MSINDTVQTHLRQAGLSAYAQQAAPVVTALVQREEQGIARIIEMAKDEGLSEDRVRAAFADLGAHVPAPVTAAGGDAGLTDRVGRLEAALAEAKRRFHF